MGREIFAAVAGTPAASKGDYFKKGSGTAVILECLRKETDESGEMFIPRFKVLTATGKDGSVTNAPGDKVAWPQFLTKSKFPKIARANVKAFVLAVTGDREADITADQFIATWEDMINYQAGSISEYNKREIKDVQAARGVIIGWTTYDQQTKGQKEQSKAGGKYESNTYVTFSHVPDQGDIEARIAELDKTDPVKG